MSARTWHSPALVDDRTEKVVGYLRGLVVECQRVDIIGARGAIRRKSTTRRREERAAMYAVAHLLADVLMVRANPGGWTAESLISTLQTDMTNSLVEALR